MPPVKTTVSTTQCDLQDTGKPLFSLASNTACAGRIRATFLAVNGIRTIDEMERAITRV